MMGTLPALILLAAAELCPLPFIQNQTDAWTVRDQMALRVATKGCPHYYGEKSCLNTFIKIEPDKYRAICKKFFD